MAKTEKKAAPAAPKKQAEVSTGTPVKVSAEKIKKAIEHAEIAHPHAEYVYVNVKGEHHLHPRPGFVKVDVSDGEVIAEQVAKVKAAKQVPVNVQIEDDGEPVAPNDNLEY